MSVLTTLAQTAQDWTPLAADAPEIPDPKPVTPDGMKGPMETMLGMLKWGGYAIAAGSLIISGIKMTFGGGGGRGATVAADGASEIPWKLVGVALIGASAGILGQILGG
ncbi:hypothetical protein GTW37_39445 [Streptomyces sp. SID4931]|nr:hypothetical protein [Streptomyces sp. SID4931]SCG10278.1 hypothetical protein GA0115255_127285 [Streptomyces sp. Ncost-T6T-2b]